MFYLQPEKIGTVVGQVIPAALSPDELDFVSGEMHVTAGVGHKVNTFEITPQNEWFLRITPGVAVTKDQFAHNEDWKSTASLGTTFSNGAEMNIVDSTNLSMTFSKVPTTEFGSATVANLKVTPVGGWASENWLTMGSAFEGQLVLPNNTSKAAIVLGSVTSALSGSKSVFGYFLHRVGGSLYLSKFSDSAAGLDELDLNLIDTRRVGTYTGLVTFSFAYMRHEDNSVFLSYSINGSRPITEKLWFSLQWRTINGDDSPSIWLKYATLKKVAFLFTQDSYYVYSLPELGLGQTANNQRTVSADAVVVSPKRIKTSWNFHTVSAVKVDGKSIAGPFVPSGTEINIDVTVGLHAHVEVTGVVKDFDYTYRGFMDETSPTQPWVGCDLNWTHKHSPLYTGHVYVYARPISIRHGGYWTKRSNQSAIFHQATPSHDKHVQLLAFVNKPSFERPQVIDLRTPPDFNERGTWSKDKSFEGPAYQSSGAVVVTVPSDKETLAKQTIEDTMPAGIVGLITNED